MYDANGVLQALVTSTTSYTSTAVDLGTGTPVRGLNARILVSSYASVTTAGTVFGFSLLESTDNTTFNTLVTADPPLTGATSAATKELFLHFRTNPGNRYVKLLMTISASTGSPSISYMAEIGSGIP